MTITSVTFQLRVTVNIDSNINSKSNRNFNSKSKSNGNFTRKSNGNSYLHLIIVKTYSYNKLLQQIFTVNLTVTVKLTETLTARGTETLTEKVTVTVCDILWKLQSIVAETLTATVKVIVNDI